MKKVLCHPLHYSELFHHPTTEIWYPLNSNSSSLVTSILLSVSVNPCTGYLIQVKLHTSPFVADFFHLAHNFKVPLCCHMCQHVSFFYVWIIPYLYHFLFTHQLMDTWAVLLPLAAVNDATIKVYLFKSLLWVLLGTYLWMEMLDHIVTLYLAFWGTAKLFSKGCHV